MSSELSWYEEPDALIAHVRICGGRGLATALVYPTNDLPWFSREALEDLSDSMRKELGLVWLSHQIISVPAGCLRTRLSTLN